MILRELTCKYFSFNTVWNLSFPTMHPSCHPRPLLPRSPQNQEKYSPQRDNHVQLLNLHEVKAASGQGQLWRDAHFTLLLRCSFTRNLTMRLTRSSGSGLSIGNCTAPLDHLYGDNSCSNAAMAEEVG